MSNSVPNTTTKTSAYWFKRKRYGWGWTPATREGWLVIAGFVVALVLPALVLGSRLDESGWWLVVWLGWVAVMIAGLLIITSRHAPPGQWRWGTKPDDNPAEDI